MSQEQEGTWGKTFKHTDGGTVPGCVPAALLEAPFCKVLESLCGLVSQDEPPSCQHFKDLT